MKILVTGAAGFIGYHLSKSLLSAENDITGVDNLNSYYSQKLKRDRLKDIQIRDQFNSFNFVNCNIEDKEKLMNLFKEKKFDYVVNLAAQAGVRYSIDNPDEYIQSNLVGFNNILECCRYAKIKHLIFASSSSVYGMNKAIPFTEVDNTDYPISLYAATKKSNELMAHSYSHLYDIPITGLRFFTVYGPFGRPDMAYFKFTKSILEGKKIDLFNNGKMSRDFTYIDDVVTGINKLIKKYPKIAENEYSNSNAAFKIYNIGNNSPVSLKKFVNILEENCGRKAIVNNKEMQLGDVPATYADIDMLNHDIGFRPETPLELGLKDFVTWYLNYYKE